MKERKVDKQSNNGRIYTRDELFDAEFVLGDDLPIWDDLGKYKSGV